MPWLLRPSQLLGGVDWGHTWNEPLWERQIRLDNYVEDVNYPRGLIQLGKNHEIQNRTWARKDREAEKSVTGNWKATEPGLVAIGRDADQKKTILMWQMDSDPNRVDLFVRWTGTFWLDRSQTHLYRLFGELTKIENSRGRALADFPKRTKSKIPKDCRYVYQYWFCARKKFKSTYLFEWRAFSISCLTLALSMTVI